MQKITIIRDQQGVLDLIEYIKDKDFIAFDTETDGVDKESRVIGYSVCAEVDEGFYVITRQWDVVQQKLIELDALKHTPAFFQSLIGKNLIAHNAIFDCQMILNNFNVNLIESIHTDTMVLGHLLNENRSNGLKERAIELYGEDSTAEQAAMKASVAKNGGVLTKILYELYKADSELIAHYGAKDAILTLKLFYNDVPLLYEQGLDKFFYEDESMPLLRTATYDLNTTGLRVDPERLQNLKAELEADCIEAKAFIEKEIHPYVKDKYPGDKKTNKFNIGAGQQLSWLLFIRLNNDYTVLTKVGKEVCKALNLKLPYSPAARRAFIQVCESRKNQVWKPGHTDVKTGKIVKPKKIGNPWAYITCDKTSLAKSAKKYKWVEKLLEYKKNLKLLNTYVEGIQERMRYNIIRPAFLQIGTTSGRYSSKNPNFQNLPRDDKRVKSCIVARKGKIFVGADYSQLEPRVFASFSKDTRLLKCFENGDDFYSVIGVEVFGKHGCSLKKDEKGSFAELYPELRAISKTIALSATYGTTAHKMAPAIGKSIEECQQILDSYFDNFPDVHNLMMSTHEQAKAEGVVYNLYGRPRRMPEAKLISKLFGKVAHSDLPYEYRNKLNLAINHTIQSTGASIMNRAAIEVCNVRKQLATINSRWNEVKIALQVHDSLVLEGPVELENEMKLVLQDCLENSVQLPGIKLLAEPFASYDLSGQK